MANNTMSLELSKFNFFEEDRTSMISLVQSWVKIQANGLIEPDFITLRLMEELELPSSKPFYKVIEVQDPSVSLVVVKLTPYYNPNNVKCVRIIVRLIGF